MPKAPPPNAEEIRISAEDADLIDLFVLRRSFNKDGSIRYLQVVGFPEEVEAFARGERVPMLSGRSSCEQRSYSMPRIIMQRILKRPLLDEELVKSSNGNMGDCRRENLELTTRSEIAQRERSSWAVTGAKYVYPADNGRFYANADSNYLGTYDTVELAAKSVESFFRLIENGMEVAEAARRIKGRSRNSLRVIID